MASSRYTTRLSPILKNRAVNTYSTTVFSLIAVIIFAVFAIDPTVKTIITLQKTINDQTKTLNNLKQKSQDLSTAINNYNSIPGSTKIKLFTLLPNNSNIMCLVSDLNNIAGNSNSIINGLQIQSADLNKPSKCLIDETDVASYRQNVSSSVNLQAINFSISNQAGFTQLNNFLSTFNSSTRLINIGTVTFSRPIEGSVNLTMEGKAYFYK